MKRLFFLFVLLSMSLLAAHAATDTTLVQANDCYAQGNYAQAATLYQQILSDEGESAELYYNLGNAYYKNNELGNAIVSYERALRLRPFYADAQYNLELAQNRIVDNVDNNHLFFLRDWARSFCGLLSANGWAVVSIILFALCLSLFLLFAFGRKMALRKAAFYVGVVALLFSVVTLVFASAQNNRWNERDEAIVMQGTAAAKSAPDVSGTDLFVLHEGTKVRIMDTVGEWCEIHLGNGNVGWMQSTILERI